LIIGISEKQIEEFKIFKFFKVIGLNFEAKADGNFKNKAKTLMLSLIFYLISFSFLQH
jgi:hypothetical protein